MAKKNKNKNPFVKIAEERNKSSSSSSKSNQQKSLDAFRSAASGGGGGGNNKNNKKLRDKIKEKAAAGASLAQIKQSSAAQKFGNNQAVKNIFAKNTPIQSNRVTDLINQINASKSGGGGGGSRNSSASNRPSPRDFGGTSPSSTAGGFPSSGTDVIGGSETPQFSPQDFVSIFENQSIANENLANIQGGFSVQAAQIGANASVAAAGLRADADKEVARAYADAQKFSSERGLEGTKYVADRESEWRKAVANIEVQGRLDLQPIINAGIQRVAEIEGATQRDVADITGKFNLASTRARTDADERISKVQLAGNLYGLINSVFG